ncbi:hypothetical protein [Amphritea sp. HPY]|uniref:hypothetical protein n=1 Tax=Amphritea sp. HPY TaxID=3421652 RepID=UPI003D7F0748
MGRSDFIVPCAFILFGAPGLQAADQSNKVDVSFTAASEYTDNTFKTATHHTGERQDNLGLLLNSQHSGEVLETTLTFDINHRSFSKDSDDDEITAEGLAQAIAQINQYLETTAYFSRKEVVSDPKQQTLLSNTDERSITGIDLQGTFAVTPVDRLILTPEVSLISYENASELDSKRYGINSLWQHSLSSVNDLTAGYSFTKIEYDSSQNDQNYERAFIGFNSELRLLSYSAEAGYNLINPAQGNETREPYYRFDITFDNSVHTLAASGSSIITDTSLGDGNLDPISDDTSTSGSSQQLDQLTREELAISYAYSQFCNICTIGADATWLQEKHVNLLIQNLEERSLSAFIRLNITPYSTVNFSISRKKADFEFDAISDYRETTALVNYKHQLSRQMTAGLFTRYEKRDSDIFARSYSELSGGMSLKYDL